MKAKVCIKRVFIFAVSMVVFSSCVSSRISPGMSVGVPLKKGQAPIVEFQWNDTGRTY